MGEPLKHWTVVTRHGGHYDVNCRCGWTTYAIDWQHAVTAAKTHKENR